MNELKKNTVKADNQLKKSNEVTFEGSGETRIMFVGNSITRHGVLPEIGWHWDFGMAASSKEKDYVHLLMKKIDEKISAGYCICQAAHWESNYQKGEEDYTRYDDARDFGADIIIMRLVENCPADNWNGDFFREKYKELISYINSNNAKLLISTGFWKHPGDDDIKAVADELGVPCVYLGDLGELDEMKAVGKFEHSGVANHPGDLGMQEVADRLWAELEKLI